MTYASDEIPQAVEILAGLARPGGRGWLTLWSKLNQIKLRDAQGVYWLVGPASGQWYRFAGHTWQPGGAPTGCLVGPTLVRDVLDFQRDDDGSPDAEPEVATTPSAGEAPADRLEAFIQHVETVVEQFDSGKTSSRAADRVLANALLPDKQGRLWTIAARSKQWHVLEETAWRPTPSIPVDWLPSVDELPGLAETVVRNQTVSFLVHDVPSTPEPIVKPLSPPPGMPELPPPPMTLCPACGQTILAHGDFCSACGARLGSGQRGDRGGDPAGGR